MPDARGRPSVRAWPATRTSFGIIAPSSHRTEHPREHLAVHFAADSHHQAAELDLDHPGLRHQRGGHLLVTSTKSRSHPSELAVAASTSLPDGVAAEATWVAHDCGTL